MAPAGAVGGGKFLIAFHLADRPHSHSGIFFRCSHNFGPSDQSLPTSPKKTLIISNAYRLPKDDVLGVPPKASICFQGSF